jgi:hypothetical protein
VGSLSASLAFASGQGGFARSRRVANAHCSGRATPWFNDSGRGLRVLTPGPETWPGDT